MLTTESMPQAPDYAYVGEELELFQHATNWKGYFRSRLRPYLTGGVLEVGAGLGGTARLLCDGRQRGWTALEPDRQLLEQFRLRAESDPYPLPVELIAGTTADLAGRHPMELMRPFMERMVRFAREALGIESVPAP